MRYATELWDMEEWLVWRVTLEVHLFCGWKYFGLFAHIFTDRVEVSGLGITKSIPFLFFVSHNAEVDVIKSKKSFLPKPLPLLYPPIPLSTIPKLSA